MCDNPSKPGTVNDELDVFYTNEIPESIKELLVYIAREGVAVVDLFRRPGNTLHIKRVIHQLKRGENIDWCKYNFYTLANIAKRYLLQIEGGILGPAIEKELIDTLDLPDDQSRLESMTCILQSLPPEVKQLLALLFGTWFRMIYHSEVNAMSVEAVAKSVAGSVFPSCTVNPLQVNKASKVMEYLITGFASSELFGAPLIEYFTTATQTSISRIEKFKYEFVYPRNVPKKKSTRLFVRMLLEEACKHGFDLLRDEVTEAEFREVDGGVTLSEDLADERGEVEVAVRAPRKRRLSRTMTMPQPGHQDHQVQQTSEKRTCVTASDLGLTATCASSPSVVSRKAARMDLQSGREDVSLMDEVIKTEMRLMQLSKSTVAENGGGGSRFSCVKLQQLERLQKRSDWFLSPPVGCRSQTLLPWHACSPPSGSEARPMSAEIRREKPNNDRLTDSFTENNNEKKEASGDFRQPLPSQMSLSDPTLFKSCNGDQQQEGPPQDTSKEVLVEGPNESSLSEEIEVRYFVVHKFYGLAPRAEE